MKLPIKHVKKKLKFFLCVLCFYLVTLGKLVQKNRKTNLENFGNEVFFWVQRMVTEVDSLGSKCSRCVDSERVMNLYKLKQLIWTWYINAEVNFVKNVRLEGPPITKKNNSQADYVLEVDLIYTKAAKGYGLTLRFEPEI